MEIPKYKVIEENVSIVSYFSWIKFIGLNLFGCCLVFYVIYKIYNIQSQNPPFSALIIIFTFFLSLSFLGSDKVRMKNIKSLNIIKPSWSGRLAFMGMFVSLWAIIISESGLIFIAQIPVVCLTILVLSLITLNYYLSKNLYYKKNSPNRNNKFDELKLKNNNI